MKRPLELLHTCGCVLLRHAPRMPFASCPLHGFGQEAVGVVMLYRALQERPRFVQPPPTGPGGGPRR